MLGFTITTLQAIPSDATHGFALAGTMDAHSATALQPLLNIEPGSKMILDFAQVVQVNSMGLAQFLRLLNAWHAKDIGVEVVNVNRMISVLFKMTGLNRYFSNAEKDNASQRQTLQEKETTAKTIESVSLATTEQSASSRLLFQVYAQSINQMNGWFLFNNYLQRQLGRNVRVNVAPPANTFDINTADAHLMFVKPFEACYLLRERGYQALARPMDEAKEVVIVVRALDERKDWLDFAGAKVITASRNSFIYLLGRYLCDESGLDSSQLQFEFSGNDIKALMQLLRGQADILLMSHKTYRELSELSRRDTRVLETSQTQFAYPMLCAAPSLLDSHELLSNIFTEMQDSPVGSDILKELDLQGWIPMAREEVDMLTLLYDRYATLL
ncbi:MAG: PhnD/SsuA/transferrin family substrate-binding protein [Methylococcaceae bacterium]